MLKCFSKNLCFIICFFTCSLSIAHPSDSDELLHLAAGTKIKFNAEHDINVLPKSSEVSVKDTKTSLIPDADQDGASDFLDWCANTPAGAKVWTYDDVEAGLAKQLYVGCAGKLEEIWLYDRNNPEKVPETSHKVICILTLTPSTSDRLLKKDQIYTVTGTAVIPAGIETVAGVRVFLKVAGGARLSLMCYHGTAHLSYGPTPKEPNFPYDIVFDGDLPTIAMFKRVVNVISQPDPIVIE